MYQTLLTELENGILRVKVNRPDKLNALNRSVFDDLFLLMDQVESDATIRGVILTGAGPKAFVAGADISEFNSLEKDAAMALAKRGQDCFFRIERCSKPVLAAVNGFALGGGCELAMSCHLRLASENARFGQPEVNLGLIPGYGGTQRLTQLVGKGRALELMISGNMINATEAHRIGLVNHVHPAEALLEEAKKLMETILSKGPAAVGHVIAAVNACGSPNDAGYAEEVRRFGECFGTDEMKEGVSAFLEKRNPRFR
ncbi:MAG: enoyl-CoA hydratase [Bacteroidetes bacterium]|nr:enoyl-CoA hydratase [Bacteroidota bacterium]